MHLINMITGQVHHSWPDNRGGIMLPVDRQLLNAKEKNLGDSEAKPLHCHSPTSSSEKTDKPTF